MEGKGNKQDNGTGKETEKKGKEKEKEGGKGMERKRKGTENEKGKIMGNPRTFNVEPIFVAKKASYSNTKGRDLQDFEGAR